MKIISNLLIPILSLGAGTLAQAHAFLDHADPKVGSTLTASPSVVKGWYTEELEPAFSKIEVFDSTGKEIDQKDSKVDSADKSLMSVSVPKPSTWRSCTRNRTASTLGPGVWAPSACRLA